MGSNRGRYYSRLGMDTQDLTGIPCRSSADFSAVSGMLFDNVVVAFSPPGLCEGYPLMLAFVPSRGRIAAHLFWMGKSHM